MRYSFSTGSLEAKARFEGFRDTLVRRLFQLDLVSRADTPYRGMVDLFVGGPTVFGQVYGSAAEFNRSRQLARQCEEGVWLLLNRNGRLRVTQDDVQQELAPGDGIIFDAVRAHTGHCMVESDTWVVQVPDTLLRTLRPKEGANKTTLLRADAGLTRMITGLLNAHQRVADQLSPQAEFATAQYLADLVAVAMGTDRDGANVDMRGLKAARLQAIFDDIARHYLDADIGAADVARRLGVTPRYVHLLLEETGRTFSDHVLDHRLALARRILLDPGRATARIADLAYSCGFSDLSYFNRTYRRHFGETPSETRVRL